MADRFVREAKGMGWKRITAPWGGGRTTIPVSRGGTVRRRLEGTAQDKSRSRGMGRGTATVGRPYGSITLVLSTGSVAGP